MFDIVFVSSLCFHSPENAETLFRERILKTTHFSEKHQKNVLGFLKTTSTTNEQEYEIMSVFVLKTVSV